MSLIRTTFFVWFVLLLSCEDNKKTSEEKVQHVEQNAEKKEETLTLEVIEESKKTSEIKYPKLVQDSVVPFFTSYGKKNPETRVKISTSYGDIDIQLYKDTPLHRASFIYLVKEGYFNETFFHRVVPNFIIQGGNSDNVSTPRKRTKIGSKYLLPAEINRRNHRYGSISGAKEYRENPNKLSLPFEFFIFLGPETSTRHLNGNYTVFGKVISGMKVVEVIANLPSDKGEWPLDNVYITAEVLP